MITPTTSNRNTHAAIVELSKKSNLAYFTLSDGVDIRQTWVMLLCIGIVTLASIGGGSAGWLIGEYLLKDGPQVTLAVTLLALGTVGYFAGRGVYRELLDAAAASYEAEMDARPDLPTQRAGMVQVTPRRMIKLSTDDKTLLSAFAQRYPIILTFGYNTWEQNTPLTRNDIRQVRKLVIRMGAAVTLASGEVKLNDFGDSQIPLWTAGNFSEVEDTPLPPEAV